MNLSSKKNILQLAALLRTHGIKNVVTCPGSLHIPIIRTLTSLSDFRCMPVSEDRNAGYYALGLALHDGTPTAIVCSSGSSLLNLYPAVAEAYRQQVALVVISAATPQMFVGQQERQSFQQSGIFGNMVKACINLQPSHGDEQEWDCNRQINEALLETHHHGKGPVHINVEIDNPLFECIDAELPKARIIKRYEGLNMYDQDYQPLIQRLNQLKRRMIVAGQMNSIYEFDKKIMHIISKQFAWLTENLSNQTTPPSAIHRLDEILYPMSKQQQDQLAPDLLITFGGDITSRRLKYFLQKHKPVEHWHIAKDGRVADMFGGALTTVIEMDPFEFLQKTAPLILDIPSTYSKQWEQLEANLPTATFDYSSMQALGKLMALLPNNCALHLAGGSVASQAQMFHTARGIEVQSNRGINGAEGVLPTALGYATASERINYLVIGDLGFFRSLSALWNSGYGSNVRIMLINNQGSSQLLSLPGLEADSTMLRHIVGQHHATAQSWAADCGFQYLSAHNEAELSQALTEFTQPSITANPLLLEVFTDKETDIRLLKEHLKKLK